MKSDKFQSYYMSLVEYNALNDQETDCDDGDELQVIDEKQRPRRVVKYCVAFNGHWCER